MPYRYSSKTLRYWISEAVKSQQLFFAVLKSLVHLMTAPYYRIFQFNTLKPILRIAACTLPPAQYEKILHLLIRWRTRKLAELQFISIACAVIAAAVIGSFSWNAVPNAYWLASALWYCSLVFSILGILLSAQQVAVLDLLGAPRLRSGSRSAMAEVRRYLPLMLTEVPQQRFEDESRMDGCELGVWKPRWKMIFTWQCPVMFMSYSVCLYLAGLTIFVCTPLIHRDGWSADSNAAVVFLALAAFAGGVFVFCSFWVYHYVDLEHEADDMIGTEM